MRKHVLQLGVAFTLCVSAISVGGAANVSAAPLLSPVAAVPIASKLMQSVTIQEQVLTSKTDLLNTSIRVPQLAGMLDTHYQEQLNDILLSHAQKDLAYWEQEAASASEQAASDGYTYHPYELYISYEQKSDGADNGIVSLVITTEGFTGGTSMPRVDTYTIRNLSEAARVTLPELFGPDYKTVIDAQIRKAMSANPDQYFADDFNGISEEQPFYIENNEAVIVFPKYSIAPGYVGVPEFRIALNKTGLSESEGYSGDAIAISFDGKQTTAAALTDANSKASLLPLRSVAEALGFKIKWNAVQRSAELTMEGASFKTSVMTGKDQYAVDQTTKSLGAAPVLIGGKMYVPVRFFSEIIGASVSFAE
ncbi:hypothetical protein PCCS19_19110 [Paenibacillus sp. CCS19]|uniref:stalk domain-containing protein n=1 Tax=Paenibacillus sp. CCS19 TaxID=3158387 RepID=UPI002561DAA4|nr:stalk domain-containing protein [Paenibacillus cellulosilyticus]GMK38857.1 hypothetical protein PCCS19_19110 [Paenibacillus cellulosilyticus]